MIHFCIDGMSLSLVRGGVVQPSFSSAAVEFEPGFCPWPSSRLTRIGNVVLLWPAGLSLKVRNVESVDGTNQTKHL